MTKSEEYGARLRVVRTLLDFVVIYFAWFYLGCRRTLEEGTTCMPPKGPFYRGGTLFALNRYMHCGFGV